MDIQFFQITNTTHKLTTNKIIKQISILMVKKYEKTPH